MATATDLGVTQIWTVRQIGVLGNSNRNPNIGEGIQKFGARTGFTTGSVSGKTNIVAGGHVFNGVYSTSGGFSCPGDSGSAVVSNDVAKSLVGIIAWGDEVPCENNPRAYFYSLMDHPSFDETSSLTSHSVTVVPGTGN
jgi:hypothetical protein